jgi:hypothetical protein
MNAAADFPPVTVTLLALPESTPATLYGLYEVFSAVGVVWPALTGEPAARWLLCRPPVPWGCERVPIT